MPKRFVGLFVSFALMCGVAWTTIPAAAETPQQVVPAKSQADKAKPTKQQIAQRRAAQLKTAQQKAVQARAAQAKAAAQARARAKARAVARARAAAKAREKYIAMSGPRADAAARAVVAARAQSAAARRALALARAQAAAAARTAAVARARAAALPKANKRQAQAKKRAQAVARRATQAAVKAAGRARAAATRRVKAKALVVARKHAANEARAIYVALAGPRAALISRHAAGARGRAASAVRAVGPARARAAASARAAIASRARALAILRTPAPRKQKKKVVKAAHTAVAASRQANARVQRRIDVAIKAKALARDLAAAAAAARRAAGPNAAWAPAEAVIFNHPRGSKKQKYALISQLNRAIDATPAGGEVRMAMYLFDIKSVAKKLIAAHRRGVSVQILLDDNMANKQIRRVKKVLGTNKKARSFLRVCKHSCMSNGTSVMHAKFYLFSVAGKSRYVSLISSGNPYSGNTTKSWNNTHTIVRDRTIYDSLSRYFTDMLPDKTNLDYYRVTTSGKYTVYYYPQKIRRSDDLVWMKALNRTSCSTTAPGFGNRRRRTMIRVANWGWTTPRIDVARRLWRLHNAGCSVHVVINRGRTSKKVLRVLLKPSKKYGKMPVYNAWRDWRKKAVAGLYVHHKVVTIDGLLNGRNVKIALTGSQNFTALGTMANNDLVVRVVDARITNAYNKNFAYIRDHYTRRMRTVPLITRVPDRVGGA